MAGRDLSVRFTGTLARASGGLRGGRNLVHPDEGEVCRPRTPITQLPRSSQFFPSRAAVPSGRSFLFAPLHSPPAWAKDGKTCHAPRGSRASSPAGGDPRGGHRPASLPRVRPFMPQRRTQCATTEGQTSRAWIGVFLFPSPGKDWAGRGYPAGSYRPSSSARLKRVRHGPARAMKAAQMFSRESFVTRLETLVTKEEDRVPFWRHR
jgi:hypothetical protein